MQKPTKKAGQPSKYKNNQSTDKRHQTNRQKSQLFLKNLSQNIQLSQTTLSLVISFERSETFLTKYFITYLIFAIRLP
jgi:hypothetical protein